MVTSLIEKHEQILSSVSSDATLFTEEEITFINDSHTQLVEELRKRRKEQLQGGITVRELIWQTPFDDVMNQLVEHFNYEENQREQMKQLRQHVLATKETDTVYGITVDDDGDVSGLTDTSIYPTSVMLMTREKVANAIVEPTCVAHVGNAFFVAAILSEMDWINDDETKEEIFSSVENLPPFSIEELPISTVEHGQKKHSHESIRTLLKEVEYEDVQEAFSIIIDYLGHPLHHMEWQPIFKHAFHTLFYHKPITSKMNQTVFIGYDYDFLSVFKEGKKDDIKCVLLGEMVLDYIDCPTDSLTVIGEVSKEDKLAHAVLAYIGDRYGENPNRFHLDDEICKMHTTIQKEQQYNHQLLKTWVSGSIQLDTLSEKEFERLFRCIYSLKDDYDL